MDSQTASTKIQQWWRSFPKVNDPVMDDNWDMSYDLRTKIIEYTFENWLSYPNFVRRKLPGAGDRPLFAGTKKSEARKWIMNNMEYFEMIYVGH